MPLVSAWFRAFAWTLLLEQLAAGLVLRRALPWPRRVSLITLSNLASHPAVWLIFPELGAALGLPYLLTLAVSEAWAFGIEAWIYWLFLGPGRLRTALGASLAGNALSLAAGYGLRALNLV